MKREGRPKGLKVVLIAWALMLAAQTVSAFADSPDTDRLPAAFLFEDRLPVLSDFEGDYKVDQAILTSSGELKTIYIAFGNSSWTSLSFDSGEYGRGKLVSADVDNDGNSDLVWIAQSANRFITWFGDGRGHFEISAVQKHRWLEVLLTDERTQLADRSSGLDLAAVLFGEGLVVCRGFEHHAPLSLEAALRTAETRTFDSTSGFPYKERPPPVTPR